MVRHGPEWRNGRRRGFKILRRKVCEFESRLGHHISLTISAVPQARHATFGRFAFACVNSILSTIYLCRSAGLVPPWQHRCGKRWRDRRKIKANSWSWLMNCGEILSSPFSQQSALRYGRGSASKHLFLWILLKISPNLSTAISADYETILPNFAPVQVFFSRHLPRCSRQTRAVPQFFHFPESLTGGIKIMSLWGDVLAVGAVVRGIASQGARVLRKALPSFAMLYF